MKGRIRELSKRPLGLVLGGGGARGLAHIGVLKAFKRAEIPVDVLAGTSMGGIVGALYLGGMSPADLEAEAAHLGKFSQIIRLLDLDLLATRSLLKGNNIHRLLAARLGADRTFADLRVPFAVVTVDLNTGREVVLRHGRVVDAVRATMSIPGVFAPVEVGDYRLADGGVLNNVPVDVARDLGARAIVAVDVLPCYGLNEPGRLPTERPIEPRRAPRVYRDLWHVQAIMIAAMTENRLRQFPPDVMIRPALPPDLDMLIGFDRAEAAIIAGERAAEAALPQIQALL